MLSCFTCIPTTSGVADSVVVRQEVKDGAVTKQGTKKVLMSTDGAKVHQEVRESSTEGRLKLKSGAVLYVWKVIKVVVEDANLLVYEKQDDIPSKILPLHVCNVKPISRRRFKVFCAPNTHLELKAADGDALKRWVYSIQEGVIRRLSAQTEDAGVSSVPNGMNLLSALRAAHKSNNFCADCNAPDPKWISVSIGCIICIECSGVHRHLGVTISKVRSFELDKWSERTEMTEKVGNADVNSVLEVVVSPDYKKPTAESDRETREKYIYNKYVCKLFARKADRDSRSIAHEVAVVCSPLHGHKRNGSKPIHIGSNPFGIQNPGCDFSPLRRGSLFDFPRRGSTQDDSTNKAKVFATSGQVFARRHSLHPRLG